MTNLLQKMDKKFDNILVAGRPPTTWNSSTKRNGGPTTNAASLAATSAPVSREIPVYVPQGERFAGAPTQWGEELDAMDSLTMNQEAHKNFCTHIGVQHDRATIKLDFAETNIEWDAYWDVIRKAKSKGQWDSKALALGIAAPIVTSIADINTLGRILYLNFRAANFDSDDALSGDCPIPRDGLLLESLEGLTRG